MSVMEGLRMSVKEADRLGVMRRIDCSRLGFVNFGDKILSPGNCVERDAIFLKASEREHGCQDSKSCRQNSQNLSGSSI
jgi:hypothetical protein